MGIVDIGANRQNSIIPMGNNPNNNNTNTIQQFTGLVNSINDLINSLNKNPLIASAINKKLGISQDQDQVINSGYSAPPVQNKQQLPKVEKPKESKPIEKKPDQDLFNEEMLIKMLSTPEGSKKLEKGIDKLIDVLGEETKLKDLKKGFKDLTKKDKDNKK